MRILQITPYYLPHTGGIERYVYNLTKHLLTNGHSVDIATANVPESCQQETIDNTTIYRYPFLCSLLGNPIISNLSDLKARLQNYDVIHIHGVYTYIALRSALFLGKKHTQKVILTHHGRVVYTNRLKNIFVKTYEQIFVRSILKRVDHAVVLSESDKNQFMSLGMKEESVSIIPNGIDVSAFITPGEDVLDLFRQKYQLHGKQVILFLAVISERKGIFDLLHAFQKYESETSVLLIVGDGPDRNRAELLTEFLGISNRIRFTGKLSFQDILCAYSVASLYVLPSYFEGMPTTILESLAMGTPVLATDIPGVGDNFAPYITLVPPHAPVELAEKIKEILPLSNHLSEDIVSEIRTQYSVDNVFEKCSSLYMALGDTSELSNYIAPPHRYRDCLLGIFDSVVLEGVCT